MGLKADLVSAGESILDIVADQTLLIFGTPAAVMGAAGRWGVKVGDFQPDLKISPEAAWVIEMAEAAKQQQRRIDRRRLRHSGPLGAGLGVTPGAGGRGEEEVGPDGGRWGRRRSLAGQEDAGDPPAPAGFEALESWQSVSRAFHSATDGAPASGSTPGFPPGAAPPPSPLAAGAPGQQESGSSSEGWGNQYGLSVKLVPGLTADILTEIAGSWPANLTAALSRGEPGNGCRPRVVDRALHSQSSPMLRVYLCPDDYKKGVSWLVGRTHVLWVEPLLQASAANAVAGWIMQTGGLTSTQYRNSTASLRPYWQANLWGQGVIVGVGDSGLDLSHCFFTDDKYRPGSLRSLFTGTPPRLYMPYHRKVLQYVLPDQAGINSWFGDEEEGHGTHVCGSIAGAALNGSQGPLRNERGTGSAPQARISMYDFSPAGQGGRLFVPWPVDDNVLPYHYGVGARISSESWGLPTAASVAYLDVSRQFDAFAWRNPDFVSVVAAGNSGYNGMMATVVAPGTAKNVITVGASVNQPQNISTYGSNAAFLFRFTNASGVELQYGVWPQLGTPLTTWRLIMNNKAVPVRLASPASACANLTGNFTGAVVLIDLTLGNCSYDARALATSWAGAAGVLFIAPDNLFVDDNERSYKYFLRVNVINGLITRGLGQRMTTVLSDARNTNVNMIYLRYPLINLGMDSLAAYSSYGPLADGRIKPDIVAPGDPIVSSAAGGTGTSFPDATSGTCSGETFADSGTSMATALVSGHLALVRQYFQDGFYPSGVPGDPAAAGFSPSGMLLKAVIIAGAKSLRGGYASNAGITLGAAPDGYQGWGRLDLSGALPLPGLTDPNFRVQVADMGQITHGQMIYLPGIRATGTGPIYAALVWHDYPSSGLAIKNLVNDLDFGFLINATTFGSTYTRTRQDNVNNIERVELNNPGAGDHITLVVHGRDLQQRLLTVLDAQLPQRWAVAVVGHFKGVLRTPLNAAYMRPQRVLEPIVNMVLPGGACVSVTSGGQVLVQTGICDQPYASFTLREELAGNFSAFGGYLYTIRESGGRCVAMSNSTGSPLVSIAACIPSSAAQKFAFFENPFADGPTYQVVPALNMGSSGTDRLCLRQTAASSGSSLSLAACDEDDVNQQLVLQRPIAAPALAPAPPPPPPPVPGVQDEPELWYPYPLTFRTDWYRVNGSSNPYDYDYGNINDLQELYDYANDYVSPNETVANLDIVVSWTWRGVSYTAGRGSVRTNATAGAVYGGDNVYTDTQFEIVFFRTGITPPPTAYHVCASWGPNERNSTLRVKLTVFRGKAVLSATKIIDTSQAPQQICDPSAVGYVGTYDPTAPPAPSPPQAPPAPVATYPYPLTVRVDWVILSGMKGRGGMLVNLNLQVSWAVEGQTALLTRRRPVLGGATLGPDNMVAGTSFEFAYWALGATPLQTGYTVCVGWPTANQQPRVQVTMSIYQGGLVTTSSRVIDMTLPWDGTCNSNSVGYIDTYYLAGPPGQAAGGVGAPGVGLGQAAMPDCYTPPVPSPLHSLYFQGAWRQNNASALGRASALYDWDLVIGWTYGGKAYELAPYARFAGGGAHGGDNTQISKQGNIEIVYWPTGLTGLPPHPATYHACVRWHQPGSMNVTLTVYLGDNIVQTAAAAWSSSQPYSKICSPAAVGYVGSFTYVAAAGGGASVAGVRTAGGKVSSSGADGEESWPYGDTYP